MMICCLAFHASPPTLPTAFTPCPLLASDFHYLCNSESSKERRKSTEYLVFLTNTDSGKMLAVVIRYLSCHTKLGGSRSIPLWDRMWIASLSRHIIFSFCINVTLASALKIGIRTF